MVEYTVQELISAQGAGGRERIYQTTDVAKLQQAYSGAVQEREAIQAKGYQARTGGGPQLTTAERDRNLILGGTIESLRTQLKYAKRAQAQGTSVQQQRELSQRAEARQRSQDYRASLPTDTQAPLTEKEVRQSVRQNFLLSTGRAALPGANYLSATGQQYDVSYVLPSETRPPMSSRVTEIRDTPFTRVLEKGGVFGSRSAFGLASMSPLTPDPLDTRPQFSSSFGFSTPTGNVELFTGEQLRPRKTERIPTFLEQRDRDIARVNFAADRVLAANKSGRSLGAAYTSLLSATAAPLFTQTGRFLEQGATRNIERSTERYGVPSRIDRYARELGRNLRTNPQGAQKEFLVYGAVGLATGGLGGLGLRAVAARRGISGALRVERFLQIGAGTAGVGSLGTIGLLQGPEGLARATPGALGFGIGFVGGLRGVAPTPRVVNIQQQGRSIFDIDVAGRGLQTRAGGIRSTNYELSLRGYGVTERVPVQELTTLEIGGTPLGTEIPFRSTSIARAESKALRSPVVRDFAGTFDIRSGAFEFSDAGVPSVVRPSAFGFGGTSTTRFRTFTTTDTPTASFTRTGQLFLREQRGGIVRARGFDRGAVRIRAIEEQAVTRAIPRSRYSRRGQMSLSFDFPGLSAREPLFPEPTVTRVRPLETTRPRLGVTELSAIRGVAIPSAPAFSTLARPRVLTTAFSLPSSSATSLFGLASIPSTGGTPIVRSRSFTSSGSFNEVLPVSSSFTETTGGVTGGTRPIPEPIVPGVDVPIVPILGPDSPPITPPPGIPGLNIPLFGPPSRSRSSGKQTKRGFSYTPSLSAALLNIRGPRPQRLFGLETRPLPERKKKRKKRR